MLQGMIIHSCLIVSSAQKAADYFRELLEPSSYDPVVCVTSCAEAKRLLGEQSFDIVVINAPVRDEFGADFALDVVHDSSSSVVLLVREDIFDEVGSKVCPCGVFTLPKPCNKMLAVNALKMAGAMRERLRAFEKKNAGLAAKMDEIRVVNHAKWVLIKYLNMEEQQAHRYIERRAMDLRISKREVAESIIRTYEN